MKNLNELYCLVGQVEHTLYSIGTPEPGELTPYQLRCLRRLKSYRQMRKLDCLQKLSERLYIILHESKDIK